MDRVERVLSDLSPDIVIRDQDVVSGYATDFRRQYEGRARAVLRPRNTGEVQEIVRSCASHGVGLVPQGGNTSYCAAATPDRDGSELLLSLERMTRVREIDPLNLSVTVDAGIILGDLQRAVDDVELMFPLALGSHQSCRIGGNLSTNAGGVNVVRYGMTRDLVLGLEVVLPDGTLFSELGPLRKNNTGYDVKQLFIGAEGTLGVITGASFKLARKPRQIVTAMLAAPEIASLGSMLESAQTWTGGAVTSFEFISRASQELLKRADPALRHPLPETCDHLVLMEVATPSPVLDMEEAMNGLFGELLARELILDGTIAASEQQRVDLWRWREGIPEAEVHLGGSVKHDIAVRTSRLGAFIEAASALVREEAQDAILSIYGHVGDGNVHLNVLAPSKAATAEFKQSFADRVSPKLYELASEMGGTFSAEYGIGRIHIDRLSRYGAPGKVQLMHAIKRALDPSAIMNPGKVVPAAQ
ncbi:FAD-binding oxidoreductase [Martelella limonii]|uniref:FAD-binding oxidoreductase n=1 Tax=Martelella limonii TaxID=1647649 RepID=UPI00158069C6|nr:FAD-binding oxidoreductase [Martelella limonii]